MAVPTPAIAATGVAVPNQTGQVISAAITGGTVQTVLSTLPYGQLVATPATAGSGVQVSNPNPTPVLVALTGGTVTVVAVNGVTVATASPANVVVPAGGNIAVTWSVAFTWTWTAIYTGSSGNPLSSPANLLIEPGGAATLYYTAAPTWTWTDYDDVQDTPFYSQENLQAESGTYSEITAMPLTPHAVGGLTGFGTGVTN